MKSLNFKLITVISICIINNSILHSQEILAEEVYQKCVYQSMEDNGDKLKFYTRQFEAHLIKKNVLNDSSAASYFSLFKSLGRGNYKNYDYNFSYIDTINKVSNYKQINNNPQCVNALRNHKDFEKSKVFMMRQVFLDGNYDSTEEALLKMVEFLDEDDFELDFYKYRTLFFLEDLVDYYRIEKDLRKQ